jgi:hypothetical protein
MQDPAGERIEDLEPLDRIVVEGNAHCVLGVLRREHVDHVAAHAEGAAAEVEVVALVLHRNQARERVALRELLAFAQVQDHAVVLGRIADAVDRRHGGDNHDVTPLEERLGGRQAHLLDVLVDRRILLDEQIARRDVRFRLVVVVVRDEVLDRVLGEELAELRVQLRRQSLVRCEHERRPGELRDDVRHRVGLAGAGHAQQRLERQAVLDAFDELRDRFGLIAGGREELVEAEGTVGEGNEHVESACLTDHFNG